MNRSFFKNRSFAHFWAKTSDSLGKPMSEFPALFLGATFKKKVHCSMKTWDRSTVLHYPPNQCRFRVCVVNNYVRRHRVDIVNDYTDTVSA